MGVDFFAPYNMHLAYGFVPEAEQTMPVIFGLDWMHLHVTPTVGPRQPWLCLHCDRDIWLPRKRIWNLDVMLKKEE